MVGSLGRDRRQVESRNGDVESPSSFWKSSIIRSSAALAATPAGGRRGLSGVIGETQPVK